MAKEQTASDSIYETIKTVFWALLIAGVIRTLFFQPFFIPSSSMKPTLLIGDFMFVNKMAYGYSRHSCPLSACPFEGRIFGKEPERGDIIVFKHPVSNVDFIKRLIGLPGDKVQVQNGQLFINNKAVPKVENGVFTEVFEEQGRFGGIPRCKSATGQGAACEKDLFTETLPNGVEHATLDIVRMTTRSADNTPVFTVPEGQYFFMGDNRDNSTDSRFSQPTGVGFVPFDLLLGRADRVILSAAGKRIIYFWTWRGDRFFKRLD